jgi:DEAD/DEAH box helicase domain-containing protein
MVQPAFARRPPPPWSRETGLKAVLEAWTTEEKVARNLVLDRRIRPCPARRVDWPGGLSPAVESALRRRGIERPYAHQVAAFEAAQSDDVVVATPTASGKSLAYNLPVLDRLARRPGARALYLFPTKALARDQEVALRALLSEAGLEQGAVVYDGDTPPDARRAARDRGGVVITNPDMLHAGILPHHASWARFFADLEVVVIDELHTYRGVFGSHLANVVRRLLRVAKFHGASPRFLFSSATIGNPDDHARRLTGRPVRCVSENGAPSGGKRVLVYNPPLLNPELGLRQSCVKASVRLAEDLVRARVPTLVFGQSRNQVEVMLKYLRDRVADDPSIDARSIQAYRSGYLPETRRRIEAGLRDGGVRAVVSTSALELGIDIGSLGAVVCAGYPGTLAGLWQRFGRAGRRDEDALAVLVTSSAPLDQFLARSPELMLDAPVEEARVDPDNLEILLQHLECSAFELPFQQGDGFGDVPSDAVEDALGFLTDHRVLHPAEGRHGRTWHWASDAYPANAVSLRSPTWDNFVIVEQPDQKTIAEMDFRSTHTMLHEQAIYQHDGRQYQVERLDYENHKAFVRRVEPDYYTTAMTHVKVAVLAEEMNAHLELGSDLEIPTGFGEVDVVEKVVGFKKIKFHTHENVGYGEVTLPQVEKPTTAYWVVVPNEVFERIDAPRAVVMDALSGLQGALHAVAAVGLMMDPNDLGRALVEEPGVGEAPVAARPVDAKRFEPVLYLYDSVAGGVGLAARLFEERHELFIRAHRLVAGCACEHGCPSCVGPVLGEATVWSRKAVALEIFERLGVPRYVA